LSAQEQAPPQHQFQESKVSELFKDSKDNSLWLKVFLIDSSVNKNDWKLSPEFIDKHIAKFVGKPFILNATKDHPNFWKEGAIPHQGSKTLKQILDIQEKYRIGEIKKVERDAKIQSIYNAYIKITNPKIIESFKQGNIPQYVSPAIFDPEANDDGTKIKDFSPLHIAAVDHPAYGLKSVTKAACEGDDNTCLPELRTASSEEEKAPQTKCPCDTLAEFEHKYVRAASLGNSSSYHENLPLDNNSLSQLEKPESFIAEITPTAADNNDAEQANSIAETPPQVEVATPPTPVPQVKEAPQVPAAAAPAQEAKPVEASEDEKLTPKGTKSKAELLADIESLKATIEEISTWKQGIQDKEVKKAAEEQRAQVENAISLEFAGGDENQRAQIVDFLINLNVPDDKLATLLQLVSKGVKAEQSANPENQVRTASVNKLLLKGNTAGNKTVPSYFSKGFFGKL
jgi:hypothetical protein